MVDTAHPSLTSYVETVETETGKLQSVCDKWQKVKENEEELSEEVVGMIDTAVGKAQLLMSQKFAQFKQLCDLSKDANASKPVKLSDLQGFWDMVQYQVDDVTVHFEHLAKLQENDWVIKEEKSIVKRKKRGTKKAKKNGLTAKTMNTRRTEIQELKAKMMAAKKEERHKQIGSGDDQASSMSTPPALGTYNILEYTQPSLRIPVDIDDNECETECDCKRDMGFMSEKKNAGERINANSDGKEETICAMLSEFSFPRRASRLLPGQRECSSLITFSPAGSVKKLAPVTPSKRVRDSFATNQFYSTVRRSIRLLPEDLIDGQEDLPEGSVVLPNRMVDDL
jgi:hypothetical protein